MKTDLFDYDLPGELIAQEPCEKRDSSRLMVLDRASGSISHLRFSDLPGLLETGDCLVVNTSRVFPGRLRARKAGGEGSVELLLLEREGEGLWTALTKGAKLRPGTVLEFSGPDLRAEVLEGPAEGKALVRFYAGGEDLDAAVFAHGTVPLPPYIKSDIADHERYQTIYADREISAAAPTAGLHFTDGLLAGLGRRGVHVAGLELSVGLDTFVPVREDEVERHRMHSEWYSVPEGTAEAANSARVAGARIVAVGTTCVRALESASDESEKVEPRSGRTELFITPGFSFRAVDALVTNFHFPRSTLLMLVCAFGGMDLVMKAYEEAISERYRFYSFGDAMLIL